MGDLSRASLPESAGRLCLVACFAVLYAQARKLNLIVQGEEPPCSSASTSRDHISSARGHLAGDRRGRLFCGHHRFIGIMVPHMMRLVYGSDHRLLLPAAALFGASFLVAADTAARTVLAPSGCPWASSPRFAAPLFHFLMRRKERR